MTAPPADSRDARVEAVIEHGDDTFVGYDGDEIEGIIAGLEFAGLLVLLPDDATVERISDVTDEWVDSIAYLSVDDEPCQRASQLNDFARAVLAALAERPSGGAG